MADRKAGLEAAAFLDKLEGAGRVYQDLTGPAVYQLEPTWRTVVLCHGCRYLGLILTIPRRPLTWRCPRCKRSAYLTPPLDVLAAKVPAGHPRLSPRVS